jgi:hypothetical protein
VLATGTPADIVANAEVRRVYLGEHFEDAMGQARSTAPPHGLLRGRSTHETVGLSLRVSQHLALTPQLQQSIRLLQLSTLELASEVEQMLDDNPFLERADDSAPREEFGLAQPTRA